MPRIAFLLGAGATKGAGGVSPEPPLGSELYGCLQRQFPDSWGSLPTPEEDEAFRSDPPFEPGMAMLWEKRDVRAQRLIIDMGVYFSDFRPPSDGSDLYTRLVGELRGNHVSAVIATLNYECVFELAANRLGMGVTYPGTSCPPGGITVLKPHGSCNFILPLTRNFINCTMEGLTEAYAAGPGLQIEPIDPGEVRPLYERVGLSLPPVISLYATDKPSPMAPEFVSATREAWGQVVGQADRTVVIGARPLQADPHIWDPLLKSAADVWYIGGQDDDEFAEFAEALGARLTPLGRRFDEGFEQLARRLRILV